MEKGQAHHPSSLKERGLKAKPPQIQNHGATEPIMSLGPTVAQKSLKDKGIPLLSMITASEKRWGDTPLHQRLQRNLSWWTKNAPQEVVDIIKEGIKPPWSKPPIMSTLNNSRGGLGESSRDPFGLFKIRGNQNCARSFVHKTSYPLVFDFKENKRGRKMETHLRLPGVKPMVYPPTIQIGKHEPDFPKSVQRTLGSKNRFEGCLFPHCHTWGSKAFPKTSSGGPSLGIPRRVVWPKHHAPNFYESYEGVPKEVETKRPFGLCLLGRHPPNCTNSFHFRSPLKGGSPRFSGLWFQIEPKKVFFGSKPSGGSFGISNQFSRRKTPISPPKGEGLEKGVGKIYHKNKHVQKAIGCNFRPSKIKFGGNAFFKGFYKPFGRFSKAKCFKIMGIIPSNSSNFKGSIARHKTFAPKLARKTFYPITHQISSHRQQHLWVGGGWM